MGDEGGVAEPLAVTLARLEGKIDATLATINADLRTQGGTLGDHEERIRQLEKGPTRSELNRLENTLAELNRWRWKLIGFFAAISTILTLVATLASNLIQNVLK
jgi:hypothetical protein